MLEIRKTIERMVCAIVDEEDKVQIREEEADGGILFEITVAKDDVGKLIGKGGRVASAIRTVAKASGAKNGVRVLVNVMNKPIEN